ncbi:hypothetical protein NQ318_023311 [Aromia moschata]|uniref:UBX domain-containing protein 4 n=1 Tax=Aromia moschata TaxID=1265417 RepID=A0AAV8XSW0_9CUCU|nr:hypothetical protein NQ318_023311 [Aromia moschata]
MQWYSGGIAEAITVSKAKGAIFVVYIEAGELSQNLIQSEQSSPSSNIVCENDVCTIRRDTDAATSSGSGQAASLTPEEKIERAKELAQKKREEKEREEKEVTKKSRRRSSGRKMGQSVQQMKKWQEDQELKQILEQREKEKRGEPASQGARPGADSAGQGGATVQVEASNAQLVHHTSPVQAARRQVDDAGVLQLGRAADGRHIHQGEHEPSLLDFRLSTTFPRREFTANDYSQSLLDLQLTPNAVVLVLPVSRGTVSANQGGTLTNLFWSLVAPIFQILGYLEDIRLWG